MVFSNFIGRQKGIPTQITRPCPFQTDPMISCTCTIVSSFKPKQEKKQKTKQKKTLNKKRLILMITDQTYNKLDHHVL